MGWVQGTLFPFTNLDVGVMKNFQRNPDLSVSEIKVRLFAMMVMGSILGDGSDFRDPIAVKRAQEFLNNENVCRFFSHPKAFIPLKFADGDTPDQQLSFYLPGVTTQVALFNFDRKRDFRQSFSRATLHLKTHTAYFIKDFLTNKVVAQLNKEQNELTLTAAPADALMVKLEAYGH